MIFDVSEEGLKTIGSLRDFRVVNEPEHVWKSMQDMEVRPANVVMSI